MKGNEMLINQNKPDAMETIETLIDKSSVNYVLNVVAQICFEKSDHIEANWQDKNTAKEWSKLAVKIETLADKNEKI
jgi:hypothetical protein